MSIKFKLRYLAMPAIALAIGAPASAQIREKAPSNLPSSTKMTQDKPGGESWTFVQPREAFLKYRTVIINPTTVYQGPDAQFDDITDADRAKYAGIVTDELRSEIGRSFSIVATPQADSLMLHVTILGAQKTQGGVATATRVTPLGFASSALKSALGKKGTFTGSVLYAVELYDARRNDLLLAAVRRRTPDPLDLAATLSTTDTVKAVARDFARAARERLEELTQVRGAP